MTTKHTPGPWLLRTAPTSAGLCHIVSAADWRGAFIYGDGLRKGIDDALPKAQELAANARLIAAANPAGISELLDRLEAAEKEQEALRTKIARMERQEPLDADSDVFRSAFEAALKAGNWPATRQGDGYRSPSTQIAWRIAFSTVNRLKLYLAPGAQGEEK